MAADAVEAIRTTRPAEQTTFAGSEKRERAGLAAARAQDYTWEEIGRAQGRPRQAVERQARQAQRPRVFGLTAPDFVGVATPELQVWLRWWGAGGWTPEGPGEAPRDPEREQERIQAELTARERRAVEGKDPAAER